MQYRLGEIQMVRHGLGTHTFDGRRLQHSTGQWSTDSHFRLSRSGRRGKSRALIEEAIAEAALITSPGVDE